MGFRAIPPPCKAIFLPPRGHAAIRVDVWNLEHKIWPEKVFSTNNPPPPPPHLSSQNDQRDVGIILSHRR